MSGWREHRKFGIGCLLGLTLVLFLMHYYGSFPFLTDDFLGSFEIFGFAIPIVLMAFAFGIYASLMPDIDIGTSRVYRFTVTFLLLLCIVFIMSGAYKIQTVAILLFLIAILYLNHRGMTHSWWFGLLTGALFGYVFSSMTIFLYFIVGYYSHLIADRH